MSDLPRMWISDDLLELDIEAPEPQRGSCYKDEILSDQYPKVMRPIGFMRHKPRVRVKAWSMPIIAKD